jgi:hypothetical protein
VSLLLLVVGAGAMAFLVGKVWAMTIPVVMGVIVGAMVLTLGGSLDDTPLPFVTALATIAAGSAILVRRQVTPI